LKALKAIEPLSSAKVVGVFGAVWGLFVAVAVNFFQSGFEQYMGRFYTVFKIVFPTGGLLELIELPVFYGLIGFVAAYIGATLYNLLAKQMGGIKVDLK
jgi:hypothetical protein